MLAHLPDLRRLLRETFLASPTRAIVARLLPHGLIPIHTDTPRYFRGTVRLSIQVVADGVQRLFCNGLWYDMAPGDVWAIDNLRPHAIHNSGARPRVNVLVDYLPSNELVRSIAAGEPGLGVTDDAARRAIEVDEPESGTARIAGAASATNCPSWFGDAADRTVLTSFRSAAKRILKTARESGPLWTASLLLDRICPYGVLGLWPDKTVAPEALGKQIDTILRAWGMSPEHASITVEHVLYADLHGIDSHGCSMLLHYHRGVVDGSLTMTPTITVVSDSATTALLDGGGGLGHVPADTAMKLAIAKSREAGLAAVAVRNSGHYGAAGTYASMAAEAGFIGIATTSTQTPAVVPTFGAESKLGTNPIAFAAPAARNPPFLLDMATSTAAVGALAMAWRKGRSIPAGWALDPNGRPVTNGRRAAMYRRLTPLGSSREMGSHKGYGLATMVEILSAILPGLQAGGSAAVGHFFLAIDPRQFRAASEFETDLDRLIDRLHDCAPLNPGQPVLVAGDPEHEDIHRAAPLRHSPLAQRHRRPAHGRARLWRTVHPRREQVVPRLGVCSPNTGPNCAATP